MRSGCWVQVRWDWSRHGQSGADRVSDDSEALGPIDRELTMRYEADYELVCERSGGGAVATSGTAQPAEASGGRRARRPTGLEQPWIWAAVSGGGASPGREAGSAYPLGDRSAAEAVRLGAALGQIEFWALNPGGRPSDAGVPAGSIDSGRSSTTRWCWRLWRLSFRAN
jgi:hypothetical protein